MIIWRGRSWQHQIPPLRKELDRLEAGRILENRAGDDCISYAQAV